MAHGAVPIACRIPKLHQNVHNNILYWNPEGFPDTYIVKKMTASLKPLKKPKNIRPDEKILYFEIVI